MFLAFRMSNHEVNSNGRTRGLFVYLLKRVDNNVISIHVGGGGDTTVLLCTFA